MNERQPFRFEMDWSKERLRSLCDVKRKFARSYVAYVYAIVTGGNKLRTSKLLECDIKTVYRHLHTTGKLS